MFLRPSSHGPIINIFQTVDQPGINGYANEQLDLANLYFSFIFPLKKTQYAPNTTKPFTSMMLTPCAVTDSNMRIRFGRETKGQMGHKCRAVMRDLKPRGMKKT